MDMERKYPTREVDGVDVPQMGIKELIKQLGSALETMEGNRKSYTSPEEIEAGTLMVALFGNSLYYMRLFDKSLRTFEAAQDAEGLQTMRTLARNMAFLVKSIALGREKYGLPEREEPLRTHFIR